MFLLTSMLTVIGGFELRWSRGSLLYTDDWAYATDSSVRPGFLLRPYAGHFHASTKLVWAALQDGFGLGSPLPFRVLGIVAALAVAAAVGVAAWMRAGWVAGMVVALLVATFGAGYHVVFWAASALGLPVLVVLPLLLARRRRPGAAPVLLVSGCVGMLVAVSSGGYALEALPALAIALGLRARRELIAWVLTPGLVFVVWRLCVHTRGGDAVTAANVEHAPSYMARAALAACASLTARTSLLVGGGVLAVAVAATCWAFVNRSLDRRRLLAPLAAAVTFWLLTALTRGQLGEIAAPRYLPFAVIPLVLAGIEVVRVLPPAARALTAVVVILACVLPGARMMKVGGGAFGGAGVSNSGRLAALELLAPHDPAASGEEPSLIYLTAGSYARLIATAGTPGIRPSRLAGAAEAARDAADTVLVPQELTLGEATARVCTTATTATLAPGSTVYLRATGQPLVRRYGATAVALPGAPTGAADLSVTALSDAGIGWTLTLPPGSAVCRS